MSKVTKERWKKKRTDESRKVEEVLRQVFPRTDAYRYNPASIRVRIVDERFEGKSTDKRDTLVEPLLEQLPENLQSDIMSLLMLSPSETSKSLKAELANLEFEEPSPSIL